MTAAVTPPAPPRSCPVCGSRNWETRQITWSGLDKEWELSPEESNYINRQQGVTCLGCGSNLRSMALAMGIMRYFRYKGLFKWFVRYLTYRRLRVLEINEAGMLTRYLARSFRYQFVKYPDYDMMALALPTDKFDLIVHSDTLEHVPDPQLGLQECRRVLAPGGACCYTVPIVVGRLSRSRKGLPPSYHGAEKDRQGDLTVQTEFGADAWTLPLQAGFTECRIVTSEYPSAQALVCVK